MGEKILLVIQMGDSIRRGENDTHFLDISQHRGNVAIALDTVGHAVCKFEDGLGVVEGTLPKASTAAC